MIKKTIILCLIIPFIIAFSQTGKFYYSRRNKNRVKENFRLLGSIPKRVAGSFVLKAKTRFKKINVSYHPSISSGNYSKSAKGYALIKTINGRIRHRFQLVHGSGKYHFSLWGQPGFNGKRSAFLGSFNVYNTSDFRPVKIRVYKSHLLQLADSVYAVKYKTKKQFVLEGHTSIRYLMIWVKKGNLKADSVIKIKNKRFKIPIHLRFGAGKYRIFLFGTGQKGLSFNSLGMLEIENSDQKDMRYLAPSPDIQSSHPLIKRLAKKLIKGKRRTMAKVRAMYTWITGNVRYDYAVFKRKILLHRSAIDILKGKLAVCTGYSYLFAALLRSVKIPVRIISGDGKSRYFGNRWIPHAWNQVRVGRRWINFDSTWDAGFSRRGGKLIPRRWRWFAPSYRWFVSRHRRRQVLLK